MRGKDYYRILQLEPTADALSIKKAYRRLALAYHPDCNPDGHSGFFLEILEAYTTLSHPERRAAYDASRRRPGGKADHSPEEQLHYLRKLHRALATGRARVPEEALHAHLEERLGDAALMTMRHAPEAMRAELAQAFLMLMQRLPYPLFQTLTPALERLYGESAFAETLHRTARTKRIQYAWHRYKFLLILLVSLLLVVAMTRLARGGGYI